MKNFQDHFWTQGILTVEMSFLTPMILFLIMGCLLASFYFHDKNIFAGAAYETAVVGSTKSREKGGVEEDLLVSLCQQRLQGKCILFDSSTIDVEMTEDEITVSLFAARNFFKVSVVKKAAVTDPEKEIRQLKKWEHVAEDVGELLEALGGV